MSDYIYHIGNDYDCINKEYVILSTDKGQQITVALAASGVPFKGCPLPDKIDTKKDTKVE